MRQRQQVDDFRRLQLRRQVFWEFWRRDRKEEHCHMSDLERPAMFAAQIVVAAVRHTSMVEERKALWVFAVRWG